MFSLWWILFGILLDGEEDNKKKYMKEKESTDRMYV